MAEPEYSTTPDRELRRRPSGDYAWIALGTIVMGAVGAYLDGPAPIRLGDQPVSALLGAVERSFARRDR